MEDKDLNKDRGNISHAPQDPLEHMIDEQNGEAREIKVTATDEPQEEQNGKPEEA